MKIKEIAKIFGSKTKAQEILLLLNDSKYLVRQGYYLEELRTIENFCKNNDLYLVRSKFKVILDEDSRYLEKQPLNSKNFADIKIKSEEIKQDNKKESYSNKGMIVDESDKRKGMFHVYISKKEKTAYLGALYEIRNEIRNFGDLLGYPDCCIEYFIKNWKDNNPNPEIKSDIPYTNISRRNEDCVIISHFPCSKNCKKSIELGKKYVETLKEHDKFYAEELLRSLQSID